MAFVASFLQYFIIMVLLAAIAVAGVFVGKKLRDRKDAKETSSSYVEKYKEIKKKKKSCEEILRRK